MYIWKLTNQICNQHLCENELLTHPEKYANHFLLNYAGNWNRRYNSIIIHSCRHARATNPVINWFTTEQATASNGDISVWQTDSHISRQVITPYTTGTPVPPAHSVNHVTNTPNKLVMHITSIYMHRRAHVC